MKAKASGGFLSLCRRSILFLFLVVLGALFPTRVANAQSTGGRIRGTVVDPTGGAVVGAAVTLVNEATHATRDVQTGSNGEYVFLEVPVGTYEIDATSQGFKKYARKGIPLDLNEVITVDITLQVGGSTDSVEVTGAPPVIDTTSTQLGAVVNERSSTQLPLNQRDVFQLLQLQPGVQSQIGNNLFYGSDKPGVVTVNGGRGRSNNYSVNGGESNDLFANLPAVQPSPDSVEEFRVISNTFDAEYGRNSGSVINVVTKSGSNDLHGSVYEFLRNDVLNAHGFTFQPTPKPPFKQNQFGGTLGGPVKKDKTFLFGSYEGRRIVRGIVSQLVPVPTSGDLAGTFTAPLPPPGTPPGDPSTMVFSGTLNDPTVATILQNRCGSQLTPGGQTALTSVVNGTAQPWDSVFPTATGAQALTATIPVQCFDPVASSLIKMGYMPGSGGANSETQDVVKSTDRGDQFQIRLDHNLSTTQKLSFYYYYDNDDTLDPFAVFQLAGGSLGNFPGRIITHAQQVNASHSWTLGSKAVNEFRFTYFREAQPKFYTPTVTNAVTASCGSAVPAPQCFGGTSDTPLVDPTGAPLGTSADPNMPVCPGFGCGIHPGLGSKFEGVPYVTLNGTLGLFGNNFEGQLPQTGNTFQFNENYSKIVGNHSFKFGADVRYQKFDQKLYFNVNGEYIFGPGGANDTGATDPFANYLLGLPVSYSQGSANTELVRSTSLYLFAQDSWKLKPNVSLNYGLRWEMNTPLTDIGKKVQRFNPGQNSTIFPCDLSTGYPAPSDSSFSGLPQFSGPGAPTPDCANTGTMPTGLVVPGDKGVPGGLFSNYVKAFAPRIGLNWSPGWKDGGLAKLTGGPNKTTVSMGWGLFYNPIEQLVLEQFSAEPPFGISNGITNPLFSTPFVTQEGATFPNVSNAFLNPPRNQPVDWALYRPILLFGQFPTTLRTQYSAQYNLTLRRELPGQILLQVGYVGSQGHRLLAIHDQNAANAQTCLDLANLGCSPFSEDSQYQFTLGPGQVLHMPYIGGPTPGGANIPCPINNSNPNCTITGAAVTGTPINLVGLRPYASPNCNPTDPNPLTSGCPADGTEIFNSIFAEDTAAHSNYNSLQALLEKRFSHGLQFQASYTYSKSLDNASSFEEILNPLNFNATYGPSLFDSRHRFVFNYVWDLPVPKKEGFAGKVLNGWQISGIYTYQSGFPILINNCNDTELEASTLGFECPGKPNFTGPFKTHNPRTDGFVFDPNLFDNCDTSTCPGDPTAIPLGTFGNVPRTLCCNPPINNWDLGVFKETPVREKMRLEFRTEIFNIFNHAQFYGTDGNSGNQGSTFGQPQKVRDPRLFQFALKLVF